MLKYSRQREAIKTFLAGRYDHPTAETVYLGIKEEFPNISLGTDTVETSVRLYGFSMGLVILCLTQFFARGVELEQDVEGLV